jgi:hypothetical protein
MQAITTTLLSDSWSHFEGKVFIHSSHRWPNGRWTIFIRVIYHYSPLFTTYISRISWSNMKWNMNDYDQDTVHFSHFSSFLVFKFATKFFVSSYRNQNNKHHAVLLWWWFEMNTIHWVCWKRFTSWMRSCNNHFFLKFCSSSPWRKTSAFRWRWHNKYIVQRSILFLYCRLLPIDSHVRHIMKCGIRHVYIS